MDVAALAEQQELTDISSLQIVDLVGMNCWERLMIGTDEEIESRKSVLLMRFNDDDDLFFIKSREEYYGQNHIRCLGFDMNSRLSKYIKQIWVEAVFPSSEKDRRMKRKKITRPVSIGLYC